LSGLSNVLTVTFLQPFILWGLPLILLPVIIHLINRMRHRRQPWAAMRFLLSATRASTSHAKLRQFLILLFRTLAVLALLLFLARPLAGGWMGWMLSPAPDVVLILLDRSASMETKIFGKITKREQALKLISQAAKEFDGASHLVLIDSATRLPQEIINATALPELSLTAPTDTAADLPAMLQSAFNYLIENRSGSAEIWIASDLQRSNWQPDDARFKTVVAQLGSLPQKVRVRLLALNQPPERNTSISVQEISRRAKGDQNELQFVLDLQRNVESGERMPIKTVLDGSEAEAEVALDGQALRWRYKAELGNKKEAGWGSFQLPADANGSDNKTYFVYGSETPPRATVVSEDGATARFLKLASAAIAKDKEAAQILRPAESTGANLESRSVLFWQGSLPASVEAGRILEFVEQGGCAIFFPSGKPDAQQFNGISWGEIQNADADKSFRITKWDEEQGPLAKTDEGLSLPLAQTEFIRRQIINGAKSSLAAFEDGSPFLARQIVGRGEIYFCASLPNKDWSNLGDGPVLVPMTQRLLQSGSKRLQQVASVSCGELSQADQQKQWTSVDSTTPKNIRSQAGVYRSGDRLVAVNRPPAEDDLEILEMNAAQKLFAGVSFQMLQDKQAKSDALQGEIWRIFLFGMLVFLIGESILVLPGKVSAEENRLVPKNSKREVAA
ncbi:MAG: BatA domain-containing protein, partial [Verrucomicrobiota bacterium]